MTRSSAATCAAGCAGAAALPERAAGQRDRVGGAPARRRRSGPPSRALAAAGGQCGPLAAGEGGESGKRPGRWKGGAWSAPVDGSTSARVPFHVAMARARGGIDAGACPADSVAGRGRGLVLAMQRAPRARCTDPGVRQRWRQCRRLTRSSLKMGTGRSDPCAGFRAARGG